MSCRRPMKNLQHEDVTKMHEGGLRFVTNFSVFLRALRVDAFKKLV